MIFANRKKAGTQLAEKIEQYLHQRFGVSKRPDVVVIGLPRGGVPVALEVSRKLHCPLEIIAAKKLAYPGQPEYAIGAVSSDGIVVLNPNVPTTAEWKSYVEDQRLRLLNATQSIEEQFHEQSGTQRLSLQNKLVIVVDDGIATGMTAMAALESARHRGATTTILAVPVISPSSYYELRSHCNDILALSVPAQFMAVGQYYSSFAQTTNEEVVNALREGKTFPALARQSTVKTSATTNGQ
ncbi:MAG TPA: phosphoribosyltransferase family protein [Oculatellaceae cyanobacterium]